MKENILAVRAVLVHPQRDICLYIDVIKKMTPSLNDWGDSKNFVQYTVMNLR